MTAARGAPFAALLVVGLVAAACGPAATVAPSPSAPPSPSLAPADVAAAVRITPTVVDRSLIATNATADFGIDSGTRLVRVRILDELTLGLQFDTDTTLTLAAPPTICLVGPYSAPDDAGLEDRCWGDPDLEGLVASQLPVDAEGHSELTAGDPAMVMAMLSRGDERCDYPPGTWQLEVSLEPLVAGATVGLVDLEPITFEIPPTTTEPLAMHTLGTRYCGIATVVYRDQGEPPILP